MGEAHESFEAMGPSMAAKDMTPSEFREFMTGGLALTTDDVEFLLSPVEATVALNKNLGFLGKGKISAREVLTLFVNSEFCDIESLGKLITKPNLKMADGAICEAVIRRIKDPLKFSMDDKPGSRTKYIAKLAGVLDEVRLSPPLRLALAGQKITVEGLYGRAWSRFERIRKQVAKLNEFLKLKKNPVYDEFEDEKEDKLLLEFFELPFVDLDFLLSYLWVKPQHTLGRCSRPNDLEEKWEEKIEIGRDQARREKFATIKDNVDAYLPLSIKPEDIDELDGIILEKQQGMIDVVEKESGLDEMEYFHLFGSDYFEAILTEEHFGTGELGKGANKRKINPAARVALFNMTLQHPNIHPNLRTSDPKARTDTFGTYMMMGSVHGVLKNRYADKYDGVNFPEYGKCLSFENQTEAMMWLTYDNFMRIEKSLAKHKALIDEAVESEPESVRRFFWFLSAAAHKQGLSKVSRGIRTGLKVNGGVFASFAELKQAVVNNVDLAIKKDRYPQDVVNIIDSLHKGRKKYEKPKN